MTTTPRIGRPPIYADPLACQRFIAARCLGAPLPYAAMVAGWSLAATKRTLRKIDALNQEHGEFQWPESIDPELRRFAEDLASGIGHMVVNLLQGISKAGEKDWRAIVYLLERIAPDQFGPNAGSDVLCDRCLTRRVESRNDPLMR